MPQTALVTGGAGFIGSHVCEALLMRGYAVTCVDNFSTGSKDNIRHLQNLRVIEGDINDPLILGKLPPEVFDVVFHYAATVGVRRTVENPGQVLRDVCGIRHVAELARQGKARKVIYASSSEVYGDPRQLPEEEKQGIFAANPYAAVKLYGEYLFQALWREEGVPTVSLRFFNVYGPRQRGSAYGFVTARFIEQVLGGVSPTVFGKGVQTRDFVYVADNVKAALTALERPEAHGQVFNVGTGRETRIIDLAWEVIRAARQDRELSPAFVPLRQGETMRRCASARKLQTLLGVSCATTIEEGIRQTLRFETSVRPPLVAEGLSTVSSLQRA